MKNKVGNLPEVNEYFKNKADKYDLVENQVYWKLSDTILWHTFKKVVLSKLDKNFSFLDAGGGTGRWAFKVLTEFENSTGEICDISTEMLAEARKKVVENNKNRINFQQQDLHDLSIYPKEKFDVVFNFHNVLGFVQSPEKVLSEFSRVTKKGGYVISFVPNLYHTLFFNVFQGKSENLNSIINEMTGRFTTDMPFINLFTPDSLMELYKKTNLDLTLLTGFPILIYPGFQETRLTGSSQQISNILDSENSFKEIFDAEIQLINNSTAARGNNLFVVGHKN